MGNREIQESRVKWDWLYWMNNGMALYRNQQTVHWNRNLQRYWAVYCANGYSGDISEVEDDSRFLARVIEEADAKWVPPENQSVDGTTGLTETLGYRF